MVEKLRRDQILQSAEKRKRSTFREEFYREGDEKKPARKKNGAGSQKRKRKLPVWTYVATFGILFCVLAVIGSSAMIWLRKLGAVFGVHWEGDF